MAVGTSTAEVTVPLDEWLRLRAILQTLDDTSPALKKRSELLVTETEALRTALEQQKQTSIELERWFRELRRSSREKLQQALSQLSESESLRRESQAKLQSAQTLSAKAAASLKAARDESFHAFLAGAAVGAGAAAAAYLIVTYILPLFGLA